MSQTFLLLPSFTPFRSPRGGWGNGTKKRGRAGIGEAERRAGEGGGRVEGGSKSVSKYFSYSFIHSNIYMAPIKYLYHEAISAPTYIYDAKCHYELITWHQLTELCTVHWKRVSSGGPSQTRGTIWRRIPVYCWQITVLLRVLWSQGVEGMWRGRRHREEQKAIVRSIRRSDEQKA